MTPDLLGGCLHPAQSGSFHGHYRVFRDKTTSASPGSNVVAVGTSVLTSHPHNLLSGCPYSALLALDTISGHYQFINQSTQSDMSLSVKR